MWRIVAPALVGGLAGALVGSMGAVVAIVNTVVGGLAGVACGLMLGISLSRFGREKVRGVYLIAGSVLTWILFALGLPAFAGGAIGLDRSVLRWIAIGATVCCLIGGVAGVLSLRRSRT